MKIHIKESGAKILQGFNKTINPFGNVYYLRLWNVIFRYRKSQSGIFASIAVKDIFTIGYDHINDGGFYFNRDNKKVMKEISDGSLHKLSKKTTKHLLEKKNGL